MEGVVVAEAAERVGEAWLAVELVAAAVAH